MRLGIDIGGTKTDAVAVTDAGEVAHRERLTTGFGSVAVVETALEAITGVAKLSGLEAAEFESIGIGIPGIVDNASGYVRHAVNLGFDELGLGDLLAARLGARVRIENDVTAAAFGAYSLLGISSSMAYLNLGTGIAAGIVIDGKLWRGARGTAGEIGHIPVDPNGELCPCGQRGCLETVASGSSISRAWSSAGGSAGGHPAVELFDAADAGDEKAIEIRSRLATGVASAVRLLILTTDVETVVIGGGLSHLGDRLLDDVCGVLTSWAASSTFLASLDLTSRVRLVPEGHPVAAIGAALVGGA
jgi:predicted NBD/HSP70 family sugar kinase